MQTVVGTQAPAQEILFMYVLLSEPISGLDKTNLQYHKFTHVKRTYTKL